MSAIDKSLKFGCIGYGEVGKILSRALRERGAAWVCAWDILFPDGAQGPAMKAYAGKTGVEPCDSSSMLLARAEIVISAVTAANTHAAAREAAEWIRPGTFFLDVNSASPGVKKGCATLIDGAGANYVEAGVMASVFPHGIKVPMVIGGQRAADLAAKLAPYGFSMEVVSQEIGVASAIKMCRSVIIKGMEAILIESFTTARRYGVETQVLASLKDSFPGLDWERQGAYFFSRVVKHGRRRAEEMREAAKAVQETGFGPWMASATAEKQDWMAKLAAQGTFAGLTAESDWREYADRILADEAPKERKPA
jgi:3-hydroxyisobutyrate dehydrogenase-like beta-hydroxyacid dehydrogenase